MELARWRCAGGGAAADTPRNGCGLYVELQPLQARGGGAWRLQPTGTGGGAAAAQGPQVLQLGYGVPKYELKSVGQRAAHLRVLLPRLPHT